MNKRETSGDFIVKLVIFIGAIAAITVAAMMLIKKFNPKIGQKHLSDFDFDDDDFCCDCCDYDNCDECGMFEDDAKTADIKADSDAEQV